MKHLLVIYFIFTPIILFSQELQVSSHNGYAIGEMKTLKKTMLYTGVYIGAEFQFRNNLYFKVSPGVSLLKFYYTDTGNIAVFNSKYFSNILLSVKKYYTLSKKSWVFWEFGMLSGFQFSDKKEFRNISGSEIRKRNNLGFNFGVLSNFGFKTLLTNKLSFDIGLSGQTDFFANYKNELDRIKSDKKILVFSFYRKFK